MSISQLIRRRTELTRLWRNEKDSRNRVILQSLIAQIDNVLDIMVEHAMDECVLKIIQDIVDQPLPSGMD